ncbi:MAG: S-adenosylmethionine:tRNA ribosyltransferase-isomerase [Anaerolineae bacterium]|nr:S-adenosylmethionine:tRNA ribosyltransferase-isomerase [Anaerolineae bacterium]
MPPATPLDFQLPPELEAGEPPEARGLARDEVRLMISHRSTDAVNHTIFRQLPDFLSTGDVVVINTSGTLNAAINGWRADGSPVEVHLSTRLPAQLWLVEVRRPHANGSRPFYTATPGETIRLPAGASITLHTAYRSEQRSQVDAHIRLWVATLHKPTPLNDYLSEHGFPIRYSYVKQRWPLDYYQTVYATEPGSAEMPSAGRAFTPELITRLVAKGVQVAPMVLHTGVASLESHEPPYEEFYRVPAETARVVNAVRAAGKRVVAVGTTVVRALETVTDSADITHPGEGWTRLVITPDFQLRAVNAMLTGLHEPQASHLHMLQALAGDRHIASTYREALAQRYLWHEFGDMHLIL